MATSLTISSSSYAGALALPYIQAAILSGDTLAKGYVAIKENVKYKAVIKKLSSSGLVVAATCDFTKILFKLSLKYKAKHKVGKKGF